MIYKKVSIVTRPEVFSFFVRLFKTIITGNIKKNTNFEFIITTFISNYKPSHPLKSFRI